MCNAIRTELAAQAVRSSHDYKATSIVSQLEAQMQAQFTNFKEELGKVDTPQDSDGKEYTQILMEGVSYLKEFPDTIQQAKKDMTDWTSQNTLNQKQILQECQSISQTLSDWKQETSNMPYGEFTLNQHSSVQGDQPLHAPQDPKERRSGLVEKGIYRPPPAHSQDVRYHAQRPGYQPPLESDVHTDPTPVVSNPNQTLSGPETRRQSGPPAQNNADQSKTMPNKLEPFDGTACEGFLLQADTLGDIHGWSPELRCARILLACTGDARRFLLSLPRDLRNNYDYLRKRLIQRFEPRDPPATVRSKLLSCQQAEDETWEAFSQKVQQLVIEGYPHLPVDERDKYAAEYFLKGVLDKESASVVINTNPVTVDSAVQQLRVAHHNRVAIFGDQNRVNPQIRQVSVQERSPARREGPRYSPSQKTSTPERRCWRCGGPHMKWECPYAVGRFNPAGMSPSDWRGSEAGNQGGAIPGYPFPFPAYPNQFMMPGMMPIQNQMPMAMPMQMPNQMQPQMSMQNPYPQYYQQPYAGNANTFRSPPPRAGYRSPRNNDNRNDQYNPNNRHWENRISPGRGNSNDSNWRRSSPGRGPGNDQYGKNPNFGSSNDNWRRSSPNRFDKFDNQNNRSSPLKGILTESGRKSPARESVQFDLNEDGVSSKA